MQGVMIATTQPAVKNSLAAILQQGRTVHHCRSISECLSSATAQHFDYIFVDDVFEDGDAHQLVRRLSTLGYTLEIIPILMSSEKLYTEPFEEYGVKYCITKPFKVEEVENVVSRLEELFSLYEIPLQYSGDDMRNEELPGRPPGNGKTSPAPPGLEDVDVREVSQRLKRLLSRMSNRDDLVKAFADSIQEQFDADNTVMLLPLEGTASFSVHTAHDVSEDVKKQFCISYDDPLVNKLIRIGEPTWVYDRERLGKKNAIAATRYGERLNIEVLCPILSRGRLLAMVGISRFHRFENNPDLINLLRLFITFFAEALENTEVYEKTDSAGKMYRSIIDAMPSGCIAVSADGRVSHVSPKAEEILGEPVEGMVNQRVEKINTHIADAARQCIATGEQVTSRVKVINRRDLRLSAVPMDGPCRGSSLVIVEEPEPEIGSSAEESSEAATAGHSIAEKADRDYESELKAVWSDISSVVAHNFKNALVPIKTCAELLPERYDSEEFRQSFFSVVQDNISQVDRWIKQLLDFGQTEKNAEHGETFKIHDSIETALQKQLSKDDYEKIEIVKNYDDQDLVKADTNQLKTVFTEIIKNAVEAMHETAEPQLEIETACSDGKVKALIKDNGKGLKDIDSYRAKQPCVTTKLNGLGMGLACAEKITAIYGGELSITNGDSGTVVSVSFPKDENAS